MCSEKSSGKDLKKRGELENCECSRERGKCNEINVLELGGYMDSHGLCGL